MNWRVACAALTVVLCVAQVCHAQFKRRPPAPAPPTVPPKAPTPAPAPAPPVVGQPKTPAPAPKTPATAPAAKAAQPSSQPGDGAGAIRRGLDYLYKSQRPDGSWDTKYTKFAGGTEAIVVLAALAGGDKPTRAELRLALDRLDAATPNTVYARAMRAMVYARLGADYAKRLAADVEWLIAQQRTSGGWGYGPGHETTRMYADWADLSNSQLALLALKDAAAAGAAVPSAVWKKAEAYWLKSQNKDGGWGYDPPKFQSQRSASYGSMTAASVASIMTLIDQQLAADVAPAADSAAACQRGLRWLADNYDVKEIPRWPLGQTNEHLTYYLHALARACDSSGAWTLRAHDVDDDVAAVLAAQQRADGSWGALDGAPLENETATRTAFAVLCLAQLKGKMLLSKLPTGGDWGDDFRDAANITAAVEAAHKRPLRWQSLSADAGANSLASAPVLYITGKGAPNLPASLATAVRGYLWQGGIIIVAAAGGDAQFAPAMTAWLLKAAPELAGEKLPADHALFARMPPDQRPGVQVLYDSIRERVFIIDGNIATRLHKAPDKDSPDLLLLQNIIDYSLPADFWAAHRPAGLPPAVGAIRVARLVHQGRWDVCPGAMASLNQTLLRAVSLRVEQAPATDLSRGLDGRQTPVLWVTGCGQAGFTAEQSKAMKDYVASGGTVVLASASGEPVFNAAAQELARTLGKLAPVPADHPLMTGTFAGGVGSSLKALRFAPADAGAETVLWGVEVDGRLAVVLCPVGLTCPLEGLPAPRCRGLLADDAHRVAANIVLYAALRDAGE